MTTTTIDHQRCSKCLKVRAIGEFRPHQKNWCRTCYTAYFRSYNRGRKGELERRRGQKKYAEDIRPRRITRKAVLVKMMGGACALCGYNKNVAALEFDHLHDGQSFRPHGTKNPDKCRTLSYLLAQNTPEAFEAAAEEAQKCRVLCSNCHREQTFPDHEVYWEDVRAPEDMMAAENAAHQSKGKRSRDQRNTLSEALTRSWAAHPEWGLKHAVAVERVDPKTGEVREYRSVKETTQDGFNPDCVSLVINGHLQTSGGYWWRRLPSERRGHVEELPGSDVDGVTLIDVGGE